MANISPSAADRYYIATTKLDVQWQVSSRHIMIGVLPTVLSDQRAFFLTLSESFMFHLAKSVWVVICLLLKVSSIKSLYHTGLINGVFLRLSTFQQTLPSLQICSVSVFLNNCQSIQFALTGIQSKPSSSHIKEKGRWQCCVATWLPPCDIEIIICFKNSNKPPAATHTYSLRERSRF